MAYDPHTPHEPVREPDRGSLTGYAAIKYTMILIVVLAILFFIWMILDRTVF